MKMPEIFLKACGAIILSFVLAAPANAQILEVTLNFEQNLQEVDLTQIQVNNISPLRFSVENGRNLHLVLPFQDLGKQKAVLVRLKQGAILFQGEFVNQEIERWVPLKYGAVSKEVLLGETAVAIGKALKASEKIAKNIQPITATALSTALVPLVFLNPGLLSSFPYLPTYFYHFVTWFLSLLGLKKKRKPWGIVYQAISKEPIGLAIVRLIEPGTRKIVETQVTDRDGRFGFLPLPGTYQIEVIKPRFIFPSLVVEGRLDGNLSDIYHHELISIERGTGSIQCNIPLDPKDSRFAKQGWWRKIIRQANYFVMKIALGVLCVGLLISYGMFVLLPNLTNGAILMVYLFLTLLQLLFREQIYRSWGMVFDSETLIPLPLVLISLIDAQYNRVIRTRLTDYFGRFSFLPNPGLYRIQVEAKGYRFPAKKFTGKRGFSPYFGEELRLKARNAIVNVDVPLDPASKPRTIARKRNVIPEEPPAVS